MELENSVKLAFNLSFEDLYRREGLLALDARFSDWLAQADAALHNRLMAARASCPALGDKEHSQLLLDLAPHAEDFIAALFGIERETRALAASHHALAPLYACKRLFVQRKAAKLFKEEDAAALDGGALRSQLSAWLGEDFTELGFAQAVMGWLEDEATYQDKLDAALRYAAWALMNEAGRHRHKKGLLFKQPGKLDPARLVPVETEERGGVRMMKLGGAHFRAREGFALTDDGGTLAQALDHANYCIFCHNQGKDSCAKGLREKTGEFRKSPLDVTLSGCPLEEKISEMNTLKSQGIALGALAVVCIDNPMCAGTGHRICNDCMKACIYQKQEPVNIPLVETHTLRDVLNLPYGFEIYSLLTRWNPLNVMRPVPRPESGYRILVAGLGPAGYTLSHHLLNDGHTVVAVDGLKIEPLPEHISGVSPLGKPVPFEPIRDIAALREPLDERSMAGFGGVAEYGITVRWDKNYLKIIRLLLERRRHFSMVGGVRFGGTITRETAFTMGFDHVALCMGAGKPTVLDIPNGVARGVRAASDFLMGLQLTGAARKDSIANLQMRLPVVVVGGGLTAIDAATESLAYYPVQVEKFLARHEALTAELGEAEARRGWTAEEAEVAEEFISHARALRMARQRGESALALLQSWGGVTLAYRKRLADAPSYRLNHEEVEKALEEGVRFAENLEPTAVEVDPWGSASGVRFAVTSEAQAAPPETFLPARTVLVAAGTSPNTVLSREYPEHFALDGKYFRAVDEDGNPVRPERTAKPGAPQVLLSIDDQGRSISFFGDLHPSFAGNVVKAMGSAKQGYPVITRALERRGKKALPPTQGEDFITSINAQLRATVHAVQRLTPTIVEVVIRAPLAARAFEPGQFYRLQNFEANAEKIGSFRQRTTLAMEGLALTGAWVDKTQGLLSTIVLEMGGSSDLCARLKPGEPVILMGPTGAPTHIPANETVLLAGGGLGNAVLFSIGKAMREKACRVLYFAGYKKAQDRYKLDDIEAAADVVVWCCDELLLAPRRPQDLAFHGNIVDAMVAYAHGKLRPSATCHLASVQRIIAIGSDRMMAAVAQARHTVLKPHLNPSHEAIGSINSPMQCMMKEICAQCLQKHVDPATGKERYVYSCFNQDQCLDFVSFQHLNDRLRQNSLQEKLTARWIAQILREPAAAQVNEGLS